MNSPFKQKIILVFILIRDLHRFIHGCKLKLKYFIKHHFKFFVFSIVFITLGSVISILVQNNNVAIKDFLNIADKNPCLGLKSLSGVFIHDRAFSSISEKVRFWQACKDKTLDIEAAKFNLHGGHFVLMSSNFKNNTLILDYCVPYQKTCKEEKTISIDLMEKGFKNLDKSLNLNLTVKLGKERIFNGESYSLDAIRESYWGTVSNNEMKHITSINNELFAKRRIELANLVNAKHPGFFQADTDGTCCNVWFDNLRFSPNFDYGIYTYQNLAPDKIVPHNTTFIVDFTKKLALDFTPAIWPIFINKNTFMYRECMLDEECEFERSSYNMNLYNIETGTNERLFNFPERRIYPLYNKADVGNFYFLEVVPETHEVSYVQFLKLNPDSKKLEVVARTPFVSSKISIIASDTKGKYNFVIYKDNYPHLFEVDFLNKSLKELLDTKSLLAGHINPLTIAPTYSQSFALIENRYFFYKTFAFDMVQKEWITLPADYTNIVFATD